MANIQQQPETPRMDHILIEALRNRDAFGILHLVDPAVPPAAIAGQVAVVIPDQAAIENAKRLLQGVTSDGDGVLHIAAKLEDVELVHAISERRRDAVDVAAKNKRGETALHCAAATGNVDMINLLISLAGVDARKRKLLRERNNNGETCLHEAVRCEETNAVQILVQQDVDVYIHDGSLTLVGIHDNEGVSPLYLATTLRQREIVQFLAPQEGPVGPYPAASYYGPGSKTALHAAVLLSRDLSEHLANWNNKELIEKADKTGSTPLHLLASINNKIIMRLLLDLDPSAGYRADDEGSLPIHVAAANGSREIVKLLAELRPSCSCSCNFLGQTILHIAVQKRSYNVVDYVCSRQRFAPIYNTRDTDGNTALHLAVHKGYDVIFCRLIRTRKLCLSFTNKKERTPLDLAQLRIPPGISFFKGPRHWIKYTLVHAGADHGIRRDDHLAANVAKLDSEKDSKSISKSAGLVAVCAALILTTSFAVPFSVTSLYHNPEKDVKRAAGYTVFVISDAFAFAFSVVAISCCTLSGFSFVDRRTRLASLSYGAGSLCAAALFIVVVFSAAMYVTVGQVVHLRRSWPVLLYTIAYPCIVMLLAPILMSAFLHARALISRLGFLAWCRAVISKKLVSQVLAVTAAAFLFASVMFMGAFQSVREMRNQAHAPAPINPF